MVVDSAEIRDLEARRRDAARYGPSLAQSAAMRGLAPFQSVSLVVIVAVGALALWFWPDRVADGLVAGAAFAFLTVSIWRVVLILLSAGRRPDPPIPTTWPRYTILAALYDEAGIVDQLVERLSRLNYPPDRLQGFLVLEAHDHETIAAALAAPRPDWLGVLVTPPGRPQTKPRALNFALTHATGDLLTVYDAEDAPDPDQLREAAARFADDRGGRLACLQAPLRIRAPVSDDSRFTDRQFAAEYASLFEATLPGMARLGLPFPLGGTSNHFRVDVLRAVGGWDAWNVTEDADLGFRLWSRGWTLGVIARPTWETPPGGLKHWLPQRTRWLKGHLQTWGVHTRRPWRLGWRGALALMMTLGAGLVSAAIHGLTLAWVAAALLVSAMAGLSPETPVLALCVLVLGAASAWLSCAIGARRAGATYDAGDMIKAPAYWALLSVAFAHATWRLVLDPFAWDKTPHQRDATVDVESSAAAEPETNDMLDATAPLRLSAGHAAAPQPVA